VGGREAGCAGVVAATAGFGGELVGDGGEEPGLPFGLAGEGGAGALVGEVEHGPEFGQPVQGVEAEGVLVPALPQATGEVAVAGAVDLVDPGAQGGDGGFAGFALEVPPAAGW
jgi:hypothetical protein